MKILRILPFLVVVAAIMVASSGFHRMATHRAALVQRSSPAQMTCATLSVVFRANRSNRMAVSLVTGDSTGNSLFTHITTGGVGLPIGTLVVLSIFSGTGTSVASQTDSAGNTYTLIATTQPGGAGTPAIHTYMSVLTIAVPSSTGTVGVLNGTDQTGAFEAWSGMGTNITPYSASRAFSYSGTTLSGPTATCTPGGGVLEVGFAIDNAPGTLLSMAGFGDQQAGNHGGWCYCQASIITAGSTTTFSPTWTSLGGPTAGCTQAVVFGPSGGGGATRRRAMWYLAQGKPGPERSDWWRRPSGLLVPQRAFAEAA